MNPQASLPATGTPIEPARIFNFNSSVANSVTARPITDATRNISMWHIQERNCRPIHRETLLSVATLLSQKYLPRTPILNMLRAALPAQFNPVTRLENAQTIGELPECLAGLKQLLGKNLPCKADLLGDEPFCQTTVPTNLIKQFTRIVAANRQELANTTIEEQQAVTAFSSYLAELIQCYPNPHKVLRQITSQEALDFLKTLPESNITLRTDLALRFIKKGLNNIESLPADLFNNRKFIEQAIILHSGNGFQIASEALQNDPDIRKLLMYRQDDASLEEPLSPDDSDNPLIVLAAVSNNMQEIHEISSRLLTDRDFILDLVVHEPFILVWADENLRSDYGFMMEAVSRSGFALEHADASIENDYDLVLTAVTENGHALEYAESFQNDHEIVLKAVKENPAAIQYASNRLKDDFGVVETAVKQCGETLCFASDRLRDNRQMVKAAIQQDPMALKHASSRLKNDDEIVLAAISQNGLALQFAAPRLRNGNQEFFQVAYRNLPHRMPS